MKKVFLIGVILLPFMACKEANNPKDSIAKTNFVCNDTIPNQDTCAFSIVLLDEIKAFIGQFEDYGMVIPIRAIKKGNKCHLFMSIEMFYDTHFLIGYQIIDGKMVAYYNDYFDESTNHRDYFSQYSNKKKEELLYDNECLDCLIDKSKLRNNYPQTFFKREFRNCY